MIGWALRWMLAGCGVVLLGVGWLDRSAVLLPERAVKSEPQTQLPPPVSNALVYAANDRGHVILEAAVNGAPIRLLVDTGASLVALTPADALAAGIAPGALVFDGLVNTANGDARMAPVTLREVRIGQLSIYDVRAAVLRNLKFSLLGMSFLSRLQSYEMRDGKLTINW